MTNKLMYNIDMKAELEHLEKYWHGYEIWCKNNGLLPTFKDFLIYLDDQDIDIGEDYVTV